MTRSKLRFHEVVMVSLAAVMTAATGCDWQELFIGNRADAGSAGPFRPADGGGAPKSTVQLATLHAPWGVAVDATTVYVAGQYNTPRVPVTAVPLAGGATAAIGGGSNFVVAIDATRAYWNDGTSLISCDKRDCDQTVTTLASTWAHGIAVDATSVYWATARDATVMKVDKRGGTPMVLARGQYPYQLAVDARDVYWTDVGSVMKVPVGGGDAVEIFHTTGPIPFGIAIDDANVYFTTGDGRIVRIAKDGGAPRTLASDLGNEPWGIATDGVNVYAASTQSGSIVRVPVGGGSETTLATGPSGAAGIAVDGTSVYWTNVETGALMKTAK